MWRNQLWVIGNEQDAEEGGVRLNRRLQKCGFVTGLAALVADWLGRMQGRAVFVASGSPRILRRQGRCLGPETGRSYC